MNFHPPQSHIHIIGRALLSQGESYYICRSKEAGHLYLPGGHVEDGELAEEALLRELQEETGQNDFKLESFIGTCENIFSERGEGQLFQHEINFVFSVSIPEGKELVSSEPHIEYIKINKSDLENQPIQPTLLVQALLTWLGDGKSFFKSHKESLKRL